MRQQAQLVHHIPGRVRIRLPHAKGNRALLQQIKESISPRPGVRRVDVNPTTGSILIHYDPALLDNFNRQLAEHAEREELFALNVETQKDETGTARSVHDFLKLLSDIVKDATADTIDLKEIFPFAVGGYAFFFVDRSIGAPLWLSLMFFAFSAYMDLHETEPSPNVGESLEDLRAEIAALRSDIRALSR